MSGEMAKGAVDNALFASDWSLAAFVVPWVTYTMPEVAHVGAYERDLDASGCARAQGPTLQRGHVVHAQACCAAQAGSVGMSHDRQTVPRVRPGPCRAVEARAL
jgi:pyruvate/2-oxoglutarate dehydrogenase complex dihydrolipoamide dehydrogenase (E3) component